MAFVDLSKEAALNAGLEGMSPEDLEQETVVGPRRQGSGARLIAVAIMATMEKQGRTLAVVTRPFAYMHDTIEGRIVIPVGFQTDFASIPSAFRIIVPPFGRHAPAAVIHDYLYAIGQNGMRRYADRIFRDAMKESGVPFTRRWLMYAMVRLFGGGGFGLEDDWTFVDHEYGTPIRPPEEKPALSVIPGKKPKTKPKAGKT